jgi:uncharacterized membrane protein YhdT
LRYAFEMTPGTQTTKRRRWPLGLLALPYLGLCFPALYARATPALLGFPFFYWYQFVWVGLTSAILYFVYLQMRQPE